MRMSLRILFIATISGFIPSSLQSVGMLSIGPKNPAPITVKYRVIPHAFIAGMYDLAGSEKLVIVA